MRKKGFSSQKLLHNSKIQKSIYEVLESFHIRRFVAFFIQMGSNKDLSEINELFKYEA